MNDYATTEYEGLHPGPNFDFEGSRARKVLEYYFAPVSGDNTGYTGGAWDTFDPAGDRVATVDEFTAADLASCALLSAEIGGRATVEILIRQRDDLSEMLAQIPIDVDFIDIEIDGSEWKALDQLYYRLRAIHGIGPTRTTKLLARKRPRLAPIVDDVLRDTVFQGWSAYWAPLHKALRADDKRLWKFLQDMHREAGLAPAVPTLRVFDVLAWMDGTDQSHLALR